MKIAQKAEFRFAFKSFGVKIGIESNSESLLERIVSALPGIIPQMYFEEFQGETEHTYRFQSDENFVRFDKDEEYYADNESEEIVLNYFFGRLRLNIAEYAIGKVFIHSGVVGLNGEAILLPGNSFSGKTTLVSALIKQGAYYYSDEYAVIDENGLNFPFPKTLSVRGITDKYKQFEVDPESMGAKVGFEPLPVGAVIMTEFKEGAKWQPDVLTPGNGILAMIPNVISMRINPKFTLQVLNIIANRAIIAKSKRGDSLQAAKFLLKFLETSTN